MANQNCQVTQRWYSEVWNFGLTELGQMAIRRRFAAFTVLALVTLAGCASQPYVAAINAPGFFHGLLHGFISWFDLIAHIFDDSIRIYAYPNNGGWYDFGFLIGAGAWGGGAGASARR